MTYNRTSGLIGVETKVIDLAFEIIKVDLSHGNAGDIKSCTGAVR
jgi:hypothetical protein